MYFFFYNFHTYTHPFKYEEKIIGVIPWKLISITDCLLAAGNKHRLLMSVQLFNEIFNEFYYICLDSLTIKMKKWAKNASLEIWTQEPNYGCTRYIGQGYRQVQTVYIKCDNRMLPIPITSYIPWTDVELRLLTHWYWTQFSSQGFPGKWHLPLESLQPKTIHYLR